MLEEFLKKTKKLIKKYILTNKVKNKICEIIIKKAITLLIYGKTTFIIGRSDFK